MKKSIIGKKYLPFDNSWSVNLTSSGDHPYKNDKLYLAGFGDRLIDEFHTTKEPVFCDILTDPFFCDVLIRNIGVRKKVEMIVVQYEDTTATVLFKENRVFESVLTNGVPVDWEEDI